MTKDSNSIRDEMVEPAVPVEYPVVEPPYSVAPAVMVESKGLDVNKSERDRLTASNIRGKGSNFEGPAAVEPGLVKSFLSRCLPCVYVSDRKIIIYKKSYSQLFSVIFSYCMT